MQLNRTGWATARSWVWPAGQRQAIPSPCSTIAPCVLPAKIYSLPRNAFVTITGLIPDETGLDAIGEVETLLAGMSVFSNFTPAQKQRLAGFFSHNYYPSNHLLVQQNEAADSLWVLLPQSKAIIRSTLDDSGRSIMGAADHRADVLRRNRLAGPDSARLLPWRLTPAANGCACTGTTSLHGFT